MKLEIIYQDEHLLAVNKPSGMLSVPGRGAARQDCVVARVQQTVSNIRVVHRLDCHTSGVMLLAKGRTMQRQLSRLFHDREVEKYYVALVAGVIGQTSGIVDIPLRGDPDNRPVQIIDHIHGKPAQTRWRVLRYQNIGPDAKSSRLQLRPVTGRTHQLRVHCMALGHPIVGDRLYNGAANDNAGRMMLHAERLEFIHPVTNKNMCLLAACEF
jgi:tRNA pseudouridine32 synthase/23S rRNA pseudouridine746 synthase